MFAAGGIANQVVPEFEKRRTAFSVSVTEKIRQTLFSELPVSHGELKRQLDSSLYERLALSRDQVARVRREIEAWGGRGDG